MKSKERGARTKVNTCSYSPDGSLIGGGESSAYCIVRMGRLINRIIPACLDGALHMWQTKSNFVRPSMTVESAHTKGSETGSLVFSVDGKTVLTRGGDDTVKRTSLFGSHERVVLTLRQVWDLRSFKKPLVVRSGLTTLYPNTNAIFSPDHRYVVTGAGATTKGGKGHLLFMQKDTLETVKDLEVDTTPVRVFWHSKINQVCVYYDSIQRGSLKNHRSSLVCQTGKSAFCTRPICQLMVRSCSSTKGRRGKPPSRICPTLYLRPLSSRRMLCLCSATVKSVVAQSASGKRSAWIPGRAGDRSCPSLGLAVEDVLGQARHNMSCRTWCGTQRETRMYVQRLSLFCSSSVFCVSSGA